MSFCFLFHFPDAFFWSQNKLFSIVYSKLLHKCCIKIFKYENKLKAVWSDNQNYEIRLHMTMQTNPQWLKKLIKCSLLHIIRKIYTVGDNIKQIKWNLCGIVASWIATDESEILVTRLLKICKQKTTKCWRVIKGSQTVLAITLLLKQMFVCGFFIKRSKRNIVI